MSAKCMRMGKHSTEALGQASYDTVIHKNTPTGYNWGQMCLKISVLGFGDLLE